MRFNRDQRLIMAQAAAALAFLLLVWSLQGWILRDVALPDDTLEGRLRLAAMWLLLPGSALLIGVLAMASGRFFDGATDGRRDPSTPWLDVTLRYNLNTLEQTVLAVLAWTGLALTLPHEKLTLIPLLAMLFILGRLAFWVGYLLQPVARAFGFLLTFLPTCAAFLWLIARFV